MSEFEHYAPPPVDSKEPAPPVFIANDHIQTIPSPDHPIADQIENWFIRGGRPPVESSILPKGEALLGEQIGETTDPQAVEYPAVIKAIQEASTLPSTEESPVLRKKTTRLREALSFIAKAPQTMIPGREYSANGD